MAELATTDEDAAGRDDVSVAEVFKMANGTMLSLALPDLKKMALSNALAGIASSHMLDVASGSTRLPNYGPGGHYIPGFGV